MMQLNGLFCSFILNLKYTRTHTMPTKSLYKVQSHRVCVYCSLSKCENYTIAKSTKDHCVVVERAYYVLSVGIQALLWNELAVCIHFWGKLMRWNLFNAFHWYLWVRYVHVCTEHSLRRVHVLYHLFFFCSFVCKVCSCVLSIFTTLACVHYTNDRCARHM